MCDNIVYIMCVCVCVRGYVNNSVHIHRLRNLDYLLLVGFCIRVDNLLMYVSIYVCMCVCMYMAPCIYLSIYMCMYVYGTSTIFSW